MEQNRNIIIALVIVLIIVFFLMYRGTELMRTVRRPMRIRHIGYENMSPLRRARYFGYENMEPVVTDDSVIDRVATAPGKIITSVGQTITDAGARVAKMARMRFPVQ